MAISKSRYISRTAVPKEYPISYSKLAQMGAAGRGPKVILLGKKAVYRRTDIEEWIDAHEIDLGARRKRKKGRPTKKEELARRKEDGQR